MLFRRKSLVVRKNISINTKFMGSPIHPLIDVTAMVSSLTGFRLSIPLDILVNDRSYIEVAYTIKSASIEIPFLPGILLIGNSGIVSEAVKKYRLVSSSIPSFTETTTRKVVHALNSINRFPRALVIISQISPVLSMEVMYRVFNMRNNVFGDGFARGIPLYKLLEFVSDIKYGDTVTVVDMEVIDEEKEFEFENMYMGVVAASDVVTLVFVSNAYKVPSLFGVNIPRYQVLEVGVHAKDGSSETK